ncbi:BolA domain UV induced protein Uvi31 [Diaporthe australafricana]|uniref:BolA domain UV induced protein Uvi31 n=1 Tax=Diaporthe australafricana TaxID=127596 RepID=A0ABR3WIV3_9PEZI
MSQPGSPSASSESGRPVEQAIRKKLVEKFGDKVTIHNDSHLHKHHKAMADSTSAETHFRLVIVSNEFEGSRQIQRHRMVNQLLKEELAREGGIHALQVKALTLEEEEKKSAQE